jgi:hypothetical protein
MADLPQREWLERFAARMMVLNPALSALDALRQAISAFLDASHLEPEEAADLFSS